MNFLSGTFGTIDVTIGFDGVVSGNLAVSGNLSVTGNLNVSGDVTANGVLGITEDAAGTEAQSIVQHTDNTVSGSRAYFLVRSGGTAGGDALLAMSILGATDWSLGIDNSDSDKLKIGQSTAVGTNTKITISTSNFTLGIPMDTVISGGDVINSVYNTLNASTAGVRYIAEVGGTAAGDAYYETIVDGGARWAFGEDNSDADSFVLASGGALGTGNVFRAQTSTAGGGITLGSASGSAHIINTALAATGTGVMTFINGPTGVSGNPIGFMQLTINGNSVVIPFWDI